MWFEALTRSIHLIVITLNKYLGLLTPLIILLRRGYYSMLFGSTTMYLSSALLRHFPSFSDILLCGCRKITLPEQAHQLTLSPIWHKSFSRPMYLPIAFEFLWCIFKYIDWLFFSGCKSWILFSTLPCVWSSLMKTKIYKVLIKKTVYSLKIFTNVYNVS